MAQPEKILVRGVNWLGDAVMTTPALQRLREAKPGARITLLTHEKLAGLWHKHPSLDAVLTFAADESVFSISRRLRAEAFTSAIVLPNSPRSALEIFLAGIPERTGLARPWRNLFLTRTVQPRPGVEAMRKRSTEEVQRRIAAGVPREAFPAASHHVHDYLRIVAACGASAEPVTPLLFVSDEEVEAVKQRFNLAGGARLFGMNAGAEYGPAKRWPAERFVEAASELHHETGCRWLLFGGGGDKDLVANLARNLTAKIGGTNILNLCSETSLRELCAALKSCELLLTNDSGPMHVAAALGTPVVVPFGSTSPELTGPISTSGVRHELILGEAPCAPCFLSECPVDFRCMTSITVPQVVAAVRQARAFQHPDGR
jgi:heptosyltransferase-2